MLIFFTKLSRTKKIVLAILSLLLLVGGIYLNTRDGANSEVQYVTSPIIKGTLTQSVSATGQVSSFSKIDVKSQASGIVKKVSAISGQEVKAGDVIIQIDSQDAAKAVRDAEISLASAKLSLEKIKSPADSLSLLQAENSLVQAKQNKQTAEDNLNKAYEDAYNTVATAYLDMPSIISELFNTLYSNSVAQSKASLGQEQNITVFYNSMDNDGRKYIQPFSDKAEADYKTARAKFDSNFLTYKESSRYSNTDVIEKLLEDTLETAKSMAQAAKSESNFLDAWVDYRNLHNQEVYTKVATLQSSLNSYTSKTNSHISSLLSASRTIQTTKESIINSEQSIAEKTASLAELKSGSDALDIKSQELAVEQRENALLDAREKYQDYIIKAPFDGVLASVTVKAGEETSAGTVMATIITKKQVAEVSLNEVDAAKVKVGQKVVLSFSSAPDVSITGKVEEVDSIGTVTQNVVNFSALIVLDTQDDRVKPGMSASASIITDIKQDVLIVPSGAIKTKNGNSYIQILVNNVPVDKVVIVGISNDTETEISGDVQEADEVITKTVTGESTTAKTSSTNLLQNLFGNRNRTTTTSSKSTTSGSSSTTKSTTGTGTGAGVMMQAGPPPGGM